MQTETVEFGNTGGLTIHLALSDGPPGRQYGHLHFTVRGQTVGNPHDHVDMTSVRGWFGGYLARPSVVADTDMFTIDANEFFQRFYDGPAALVGNPCTHDLTHRSFSVTKLGMSAFDAFDVFALTRPDGGTRLVWRSARCPPMAYDLPPGEFRAAIRAAHEWMLQAF